ncbi:FecR family protein [Cohnella sp. OV330]|uniref:cadherin-like beta sandwich domain-containing protein n=1 Tax=Cohnella sp. OV330 TaxID=1855288 RepID=UPI0008EBC839|nr:cadherin-like beta sandwich domain-containing protein [Cohnella sp. OV330]SFB47265.1 FecR family protein [Cohnella sp. OV330]
MYRKLSMYLLAALLVLLPVSAAFGGEAHAASSSRIAVIKQLSGDVQVQKAGGSKQFKAFAKLSLNQGDKLITGSKGSAVLQFANGTSEDDKFTVGENATLTFSKLSDKKGTVTKVSMLKGTAWVDVKSIKSQDDDFKLETPTAIMGVRGTAFFARVNPATGGTNTAVMSGVVRFTSENAEKTGSGSGESSGGTGSSGAKTIDLYPTQQISLDPTSGPDLRELTTLIDIEEIVKNASPEVIEAILRSKAKIDEENRQTVEKFKQTGVPSDLQQQLEQFIQNTQELLGVIAKQAIEQKMIEEQLVKKIEEQEKTSFGLDKDQLSQLSDKEKAKLEKARKLAEEAAKKKAAEEAAKLKELADKINAAALKAIEAAKLAQDEANRLAAEAAKRKAEEELLKKLNEQQKQQYQQDKTNNQGGSTTAPNTNNLPSNANLGSLSISGATLSPSFNAAVTSYRASVTSDKTSVIVGASVQGSGASFTVNGQAPSGGQRTVSLAYGDNEITVLVTAQNGSTQAYKVTVTRQLLNNVSVVFAGQEGINIDFNSTSAPAPLSIPSGSSNLTLVVPVIGPEIDIAVNGQNVEPEPMFTAARTILPDQISWRYIIPLAKAENEIEIKATIDGVVKSYKLLATRSMPSDAAVQSVTATSEDGTAAYEVRASGGNAWTVKVPAGTNAIKLKINTISASAKILLGTNEYASGAEIPYTIINTTVQFKVRAADGTVPDVINSVSISRLPSSDASLSGLVLSDTSLTPSFKSGTTNYTASVENAVDSITVTPTASNGNATVKVNDTAVQSGSQSEPISLSVGTNQITVEVAAQNGSRQKYTVMVTREALPPAKLPEGVESWTLGDGGVLQLDEVQDRYYGVYANEQQSVRMTMKFNGEGSVNRAELYSELDEESAAAAWNAQVSDQQIALHPGYNYFRLVLYDENNNSTNIHLSIMNGTGIVRGLTQWISYDYERPLVWYAGPEGSNAFYAYANDENPSARLRMSFSDPDVTDVELNAADQNPQQTIEKSGENGYYDFSIGELMEGDNPFQLTVKRGAQEESYMLHLVHGMPVGLLQAAGVSTAGELEQRTAIDEPNHYRVYSLVKASERSPISLDFELEPGSHGYKFLIDGEPQTLPAVPVPNLSATLRLDEESYHFVEIQYMTRAGIPVVYQWVIFAGSGESPEEEIEYADNDFYSRLEEAEDGTLTGLSGKTADETSVPMEADTYDPQFVLQNDESSLTLELKTQHAYSILEVGLNGESLDLASENGNYTVSNLAAGQNTVVVTVYDPTGLGWQQYFVHIWRTPQIQVWAADADHETGTPLRTYDLSYDKEYLGSFNLPSKDIGAVQIRAIVPNNGLYVKVGNDYQWLNDDAEWSDDYRDISSDGLSLSFDLPREGEGSYSYGLTVYPYPTQSVDDLPGVTAWGNTVNGQTVYWEPEWLSGEEGIYYFLKLPSASEPIESRFLFSGDVVSARLEQPNEEEPTYIAGYEADPDQPEQNAMGATLHLQDGMNEFSLKVRLTGEDYERTVALKVWSGPVSNPIEGIHIAYMDAGHEDSPAVSASDANTYTVVPSLPYQGLYMNVEWLLPGYDVSAFRVEEDGEMAQLMLEGNFLAVVFSNDLASGWNKIVFKVTDADGNEVGSDTIVYVWQPEVVGEGPSSLDLESFKLYAGDMAYSVEPNEQVFGKYFYEVDLTDPNFHFNVNASDATSKIEGIYQLGEDGTRTELSIPEGEDDYAFNINEGNTLVVSVQDEEGRKLEHRIEIFESPPELTGSIQFYNISKGWSVNLEAASQHVRLDSSDIVAGDPNYADFAFSLSSEAGSEIHVFSVNGDEDTEIPIDEQTQRYLYHFTGDSLRLKIVVSSLVSPAARTYDVDFTLYNGDTSLTGLSTNIYYPSKVSEDRYVILDAEAATALNGLKFSVNSKSTPTIQVNDSSNGVTYNAGTSSYDIALSPIDADVITIKVLAEDGSEKTYRIDVPNGANNDLTIGNMTVNTDLSGSSLNVEPYVIGGIAIFNVGAATGLSSAATSFKVTPNLATLPEGSAVIVSTGWDQQLMANEDGSYTIGRLNYGWNLVYMRAFDPETGEVGPRHRIEVWKTGSMELWGTVENEEGGEEAQLLQTFDSRDGNEFEYRIPIGAHDLKLKPVINAPNISVVNNEYANPMSDIVLAPFADKALSTAFEVGDQNKKIALLITQEGAQGYWFTLTLLPPLTA